MKTLRMGALVAIAIMFSTGSLLAAGFKVATIDLEKAFNDYYKTSDENEKLQKTEKEKKAQWQAKVDEINKLKDEIALLADGKEKKDKEELIKFKIKESRDFADQTSAGLMQDRNKTVKTLLDEIKAQVADLAKSEQYDLVLVDKSLVYSNPSFDITAKVIEKINKGKPAAPAKAEGK